jgi:hypothetical protein
MSQMPMEIDPYTGLPVSAVNPGMGMGTPAPAKSDVMSKILSAVGGPKGLMNLGASLMAQSGPSPQRVGFGQAMGQSLLQNQQFQQQSKEDELKALFMKSQIQKNKQKQQQNKNHVIGNALVDDTGKVVYQGSALDNTFGRVNPGDYTPESLSKFRDSGNWADLKRVWAPPSPTVVQMGGAPNLVQGDRNGGGPRITPLSTLPNEIDAATQRAAAEAQAKATGQATGEALGGKEKRSIAALSVLDTLDLADPLIDVATGSAAGAGVDKVAGFFGASLNGDQAIGQLRVLQADLMTKMPRMEGPQSDRDVQLYREAAAEIGDPTVPRGRKKAALNMVRSLQMKYAEAGNSSRPGGSSIDALLEKYAPKK